MIAYSFCLILLLASMISCNDIDPEKQEEQRIVFSTLKSISNELDSKYHLKLGSVYEEGDKENNNKYKKIGLSFSINSYISKLEARNMIIDSTRIFLEKLNTEEMRPYLTCFPFTEKNITIGFIVKIPDEKIDPSMPQYFGNSQGELYYYFTTPEAKYKPRKEFETYPEALKIIYEQSHGESK